MAAQLLLWTMVQILPKGRLEQHPIPSAHSRMGPEAQPLECDEGSPELPGSQSSPRVVTWREHQG